MALPPPQPDSTALVTGASSGIGSELARGLAARGHGVTLTARRAERLEELASELSSEHGIRTEVVPTDLADAADRDRLAAEIAGRGLTVDVHGEQCRLRDLSRVRRQRPRTRAPAGSAPGGGSGDVNARYAPAMAERGRGAIINMSSTAGFQPLPGNGTYAAAKSFVLYHSEALHEELRDRGVTVTAVCPGPVRSEFQDTSEPVFSERLPGFVWRRPDRVAEEALHAAEQGKRTVVPGGRPVRLAFGPNRMAPRGLALPIARRLMSGELERRKGA